MNSYKYEYMKVPWHLNQDVVEILLIVCLITESSHSIGNAEIIMKVYFVIIG